MKSSFVATIMQSLSVLSVVFLPSSFLVAHSLHNRSYSRPMFSSSGGGLIQFFRRCKIEKRGKSYAI